MIVDLYLCLFSVDAIAGVKKYNFLENQLIEDQDLFLKLNTGMKGTKQIELFNYHPF